MFHRFGCAGHKFEVNKPLSGQHHVARALTLHIKGCVFPCSHKLQFLPALYMQQKTYLYVNRRQCAVGHSRALQASGAPKVTS